MFKMARDLRIWFCTEPVEAEKMPMMRCNEAKRFSFRSNAMSAAIGELNSTLRSFFLKVTE
jgi:hypothetical protein